MPLVKACGVAGCGSVLPHASAATHCPRHQADAGRAAAPKPKPTTGRIMRLCNEPGCGQVIQPDKRRCATHEAARPSDRGARRRMYGYNRARWKQLRLERLAHAGGRCEIRILCQGAEATHCHLLERVQGRHDLATLADCRACCARCSGSIDGGRA